MSTRHWGPGPSGGTAGTVQVWSTQDSPETEQGLSESEIPTAAQSASDVQQTAGFGLVHATNAHAATNAMTTALRPPDIMMIASDYGLMIVSVILSARALTECVLNVDPV